MVDYYSVLLRAVTAPGAGDAQWRRDIYDRSRQMLTARMRGLRPQPPLPQIAAEEARLEAAIERVEAELAWTETARTRPSLRDRAVVVPPPPSEEIDDAAPFAAADEPLESSGMGTTAWVVIAVVVAALGAGGYIFLSSKKSAPAPGNQAQSAAAPATTTSSAAAAQKTAAATPNLAVLNGAKNGELAPGIDGGAFDPDLQYVFRRQPTFYRTLQPVGTVIVDKLQRFLYLIQPNNVALRYGIAVGTQCANLVGLKHISNMAEWPVWQPPAEMLNRNPTPLPGGPGNPLGARMLQLDDGNSRINGTNAPKTIGNVVSFGCIRLSNDDITDLYNRVKLSTPVVVN
jgi:lipoprotein-anchoring transpeptidase ErfK/SrfK